MGLIGSPWVEDGGIVNDPIHSDRGFWSLVPSKTSPPAPPGPSPAWRAGESAAAPRTEGARCEPSQANNYYYKNQYNPETHLLCGRSRCRTWFLHKSKSSRRRT